MFRNHYDGDVATWSPQGRIHQLEYAMEAVKQGSCCVGLKSKTHVVLGAVKRSSSEFSSYQRKVFKIDDHMGIAISGLTADARLLSKYMINECLNHKFVYETPLPASRLVLRIADKSQIRTQRYGKRPFGVGLLVAAYDKTGAHLYETTPAGTYFDYKAQAIGARSQSSKTYLERKFETFENATTEQLIRHALLALRESLGTQAGEQTTFSSKSVSISVVGENQTFTILEEQQIQEYLANLDEGSETMQVEH